MIRGLSKIRIACVNRGAAPHRHMRERWSTVIAQRTKQRVGVDLIAWTNQKAAAIIAADVVAVRSDSAIDVSRRIRVQDCVSDFDCSAANTTADRSRVAGNRAVQKRYGAGAYPATAAIIGVTCGVAADSIVEDG